jgi:hypothetical protein
MKPKIPPEAFDFYASLGPNRSYEAVAERFSVSKRSVTRHALKDGWQERLRSIETKAREASDQKTIETLEAIRTRHLKGLRFIQAKAIEVLKGASLESASEAARAFTASVKEERVIIGEPERTALTVEDVIKREYARWMVSDDEEEVEKVDG